LQSPEKIGTLRDIMKLLRSPQGCPWDRAQTQASLVPHTLEEAYEVADAVSSGKGNKICEELGDLLLQIVFYSQIAEEQGEFTFEDVVLSITEKLVRRHPHIFADKKASTPQEVNKLWGEVKAREGGTDKSQPPPLPSLLLLEKLLQRREIHDVEDTLLQNLVNVAQEARRQDRCLEAELRRFCAKFWV